MAVCFIMEDRKELDLNERRLEGLERRETIIRLYYARKVLFSIKGK